MADIMTPLTKELSPAYYNVTGSYDQLSTYQSSTTLSPVAPWVIVLLSLSIVGNSFVIAAYNKDHRLRVIFNLFVFHLAVADVCLSGALLLAVIDDVTRASLLKSSSALCQMFTMFASALPLEQLILCHVMCNDRHRALQRWLIYPRHLPKWHSEKLLLAVTWGVSFLASFLAVDVVSSVRVSRGEYTLCRVSSRLLYINYTSFLHAALLLSLLLALICVIWGFRRRRRKRPYFVRLTEFADDLSPILFYKAQSSLRSSRQTSQTLIPRSPVHIYRHVNEIPNTGSPRLARRASLSPRLVDFAMVESKPATQSSHSRLSKMLPSPRQSHGPPRKSPKSLRHYSYEALSPRSRQRVSTLAISQNLAIIKDQEEEPAGIEAGAGLGEVKVQKKGNRDSVDTTDFSGGLDHLDSATKLADVPELLLITSPQRARGPHASREGGFEKTSSEKTDRSPSALTDAAAVKTKFTCSEPVERKSSMSKGKHEKSKTEGRKTVRIMHTDVKLQYEKSGASESQPCEELDSKACLGAVLVTEESYPGSSSLSDEEALDIPLPRYRPRTDSLYTLRSCLSISEESLSQATDDMRDLSICSDESDEFEISLRSSRERRKEMKMSTIRDDEDEFSESATDVRMKGKSDSLNTLLSCYNISAAHGSITSTSPEQTASRVEIGADDVNMTSNDHLPPADEVGINHSGGTQQHDVMITAEIFQLGEDVKDGSVTSQTVASAPGVAGCRGDVGRGPGDAARQGKAQENDEMTSQLEVRRAHDPNEEQVTVEQGELHENAQQGRDELGEKGENVCTPSVNVNWSRDSANIRPSDDDNNSSGHSAVANTVTTFDESDGRSEQETGNNNSDNAIGNRPDSKRVHFLSNPSSLATITEIPTSTEDVAEFPPEEAIRQAAEDWLAFYGIQGVRYEDIRYLNNSLSSSDRDRTEDVDTTTTGSVMTELSTEDFSAPHTQHYVSAIMTSGHTYQRTGSSKIGVQNRGVIGAGSSFSHDSNGLFSAETGNTLTKSLAQEIQENEEDMIGEMAVRRSKDKVEESQISEQKEHGQTMSVPIEVHATVDDQPVDTATFDPIRQSRPKWNRFTLSHAFENIPRDIRPCPTDINITRENLTVGSDLNTKMDMEEAVDSYREDVLKAENLMVKNDEMNEKSRKNVEGVARLPHRRALQCLSNPNLPLLCGDTDLYVFRQVTDSVGFSGKISGKSTSCLDALNLAQPAVKRTAKQVRPVFQQPTVLPCYKSPSFPNDNEDGALKIMDKVHNLCPVFADSSRGQKGTAPLKTLLTDLRLEEPSESVPQLPEHSDYPDSAKTLRPAVAEATDNAKMSGNKLRHDTKVSDCSDSSDTGFKVAAQDHKEDLLFKSPGLNAIEFLPDKNTTRFKEGSQTDETGRGTTTQPTHTMVRVKSFSSSRVSTLGCDPIQHKDTLGIVKTKPPSNKAGDCRKAKSFGDVADQATAGERSHDELPLELNLKRNGLDHLKNGLYRKENGSELKADLEQQENVPQNGKNSDSLDVITAKTGVLNLFMIRYGAETKKLWQTDWKAKEALESLNVSRRAFLVEMGLYQDFLFGILPLDGGLLRYQESADNAKCPSCEKRARESALFEKSNSVDSSSQEDQVTWQTESQNTSSQLPVERDNNVSRYTHLDTPGATTAAGQVETPNPLSSGAASVSQDSCETGSQSSGVPSEDDIRIRSGSTKNLASLSRRCSQLLKNSGKLASFEHLKAKDPELSILLSLLLIVCTQLSCWFPLTLLYMHYEVTGFPPRMTNQEMVFICLFCARMAIQPVLYACYSKYFRQNYTHILLCFFT